MSEFQYYEFQAVDRPLTDADRTFLRSLSSRAVVTSRSLTNTYQWGDFKGDPVKLMERCFDLHLYWANWGTHRLMIRLPARLLDRALLERCIGEDGGTELHEAGANVVLDIRSEDDAGGDNDGWDEDWHEDGAVLQDLTPLRDALLGGDVRLYYLVWLLGVNIGVFEAEEAEPLPGLGPLDDAVSAFGRFFQVDADLMQAAAERLATPATAAPSPDAGGRYIAKLTEAERAALLLRVLGGDQTVSAELQAGLRAMLAEGRPAAAAFKPRTVADLEARAEEIRGERKEEERAAARAAEERRAKEAERARRIRLDTLVKRGEPVWTEIEREIERRNANGYERAAALLTDLQVLAQEKGGTVAFARRVEELRGRHGRKKRLMERIGGIG